MHFKKLLIVFSLFLAIAAFGLYGLNTLVNSKIDPVQAAAPAADQPTAQPATLTMVHAMGCPGSQTVSTIELVPSPDLPARAPDAGGVFGGKDGNTLTLQSFRVETTDGGKGVTAFGGAVAGTAQGNAPEAGALITSETIVTQANGETAGAAAGGCDAGGPITGSVTFVNGGDSTGPGQMSFSGAMPAMPADGGPVTVFSSGSPMTPTTQKVAVTDATKIYHDVTPMLQLPVSGKQTIQQTLAAGSLDDLTEQTMVTVWGHMDGDQLIADVILYQTPPALK